MAILLWSLTIAVARSVAEQLGAITAATLTYGVAGIAGLVGLVSSREKRGQIRQLPLPYVLGCGGLFVGYEIVLFLAIGLVQTRQQVLEVGLLNYLWPALTLLFTVLLLGKRSRITLLPGTLLALAGVFLVLTQGDQVSWESFAANWARNRGAYSLGLAAAIFWALYSVLTRRWAGGQSSGAVDLFLPATAAVLLVMWPFVDEPRHWNSQSCAEAVFLGLATFVAYRCWDTAMRRGNVVLVAASSYLTPLFSTVVSCVYLAVAPTPRLWLGCGILIAGSLLSRFSVAEE